MNDKKGSILHERGERQSPEEHLKGTLIQKPWLIGRKKRKKMTGESSSGAGRKGSSPRDETALRGLQPEVDTNFTKTIEANHEL